MLKFITRLSKEKKHKSQNNMKAPKPKKVKRKFVGWKNLRLGQKYGAAFTLTLFLFSISAIIIFLQLSSVQEKMTEVEKSADNSIAITEMASVFQQLGSEISIYIANSNIKHVTSFQELTTQFSTLEQEIRPQLVNENHVIMFNKVVANQRELIQLFAEDVMPAVKAQKALDSMKASNEANEIISNTVIMLTDLRGQLKMDSEKAVESVGASVASTILILVASILVSGILGTISILVIGRMLKKQFTKLIKTSEEIARGNLNVDSINSTSKDEIGMLGQSIDTMRESLQAMIQEILSVSSHVTDKSTELTSTSSEVRAASQQVASTMQELSTGAEEQAHSSSLLAQMMEEYVTKIRTANESGTRVHKSSLAVLELTERGNEAMNLSTSQMSKINELMKASVSKVKGLDEQTKQISTLVQVIREIAEQTNLLALNAAIEAARAGEHGRGFAVVADEVRKLAEQVAHSVKDIREIVSSIQNESNEVANSLQAGYKQVEQGTLQIEDTGHTFKEINLAVKTISGDIHDISNNLATISDSTVKMNQSIETIASVSEQAAAGIEQTSASVQETNGSMELIAGSAETLSDLADQLNSMISKFKL
ncbi:methyl-accepting chemotaxis protein [Bacillus luteolus]|uniref:Methyl-accepting chemotaxis protein n=1 Tax=Litchfieldia luteola TaxID=682179 RepID=A0ABR9QM37_9BACI|nr:HAMP domain-containing methyl-accepting chemotaxis protein [Cytobacillus luteolus]MBE4909504.1 methyl-accepting chemotaxis protein [Cytobacillus luteolus]MBP1940905.1 methyl-accepting chemotaxis protein [Cytobacillus luteolus]